MMVMMTIMMIMTTLMTTVLIMTSPKSGSGDNLGIGNSQGDTIKCKL